MRESMQKILDAFYDGVSKESEAAATKVRDAFNSLAQQFDSRRDAIVKLEARIESLEKEVAELKSKLLPGP
jgi:polyhydroxyalkanoate synthesis regulator phasin